MASFVHAAVRFDPEPVLHAVNGIVLSSVKCGVVGACAGVGLALLRRQPKLEYAKRLGANFVIISGFYLVVREGFHALDPSSSVGNSFLAGTTTGLLLGGVFGASRLTLVYVRVSVHAYACVCVLLLC